VKRDFAERSAAKPGKAWQKTSYANLIRYVPSGGYYARLRVNGKLIWRSLKTDVLAVAKLRLSDFEKQERRRDAAESAMGAGKMTVRDAIRIHQERLAGNGSLKPRTRAYHAERITTGIKGSPVAGKLCRQP
jgi:hypothetical protein